MTIFGLQKQSEAGCKKIKNKFVCRRTSHQQRIGDHKATHAIKSKKCLSAVNDL
jgi:hypothetical protein